MARPDTPKHYGTRQDMLEESGDYLLDSGLFSDVTVKCGDRTWNLHRSISCPRSTYFFKAFSGSFKESKSCQLELLEQDPDVCHTAIKWLYTGRVEEPEEELLGYWINLLMVGDYLEIASLEDESISNIRSILSGNAREIEKKWNKLVEDPSKIDVDEIRGLFHAVRIAYDTGAAPATILKKAILDFMTETKFIIGKNVEFSKLLEDHPAFGRDLFQTMMKYDTKGSRLVSWTNRPTECSRCGDKDEEPDVIIKTKSSEVVKDSEVVVTFTGICTFCTYNT